MNYGQRVQNSVFECLLDPAECKLLQAKLCSIMDAEKDSLQFYYLGNQYKKKIEHFGCNQTYFPENSMILMMVRIRSFHKCCERFAPEKEGDEGLYRRNFNEGEIGRPFSCLKWYNVIETQKQILSVFAVAPHTGSWLAA